MTDRERAALYERRAEAYRKIEKAYQKRISAISIVRIVSFLIAISCGFAAIYDHAYALYGPIALTAAAVFIVAVILHQRPFSRLPMAEARATQSLEAAKRLRREFKQLPDVASAFLTGDARETELQLLGINSLFHHIGRVHLPRSQSRLAELLTKGLEPNEIPARQEAAEELAHHPVLAAQFETEARLAKLNDRDLIHFLEWAESKSKHSWLSALSIVGKALVAATIVQGILSAAFDLNTAWRITFVAQLAIYFVTTRALQKQYVPLLGHERHLPLAALQRLFALAEKANFKSAYLSEIKSKLGNPSERLKRVTAALEALSVRQSPLSYMVANTLLLWELHYATSLLRWRTGHGGDLRRDLDLLADLEVLFALGSYKRDHPDYSWPKVESNREHPIVAQKIGHPLFNDERRADNDFSLEKGGSLVLITGSNMSGKSSFLRTLGINISLAQAGAPVCAQSLACEACRLSTSIQVQDAPEEGLSRFHAEVLRIAQALKEVEEAEISTNLRPRLYLIDEMLSGTNSRERNLASHAIVRRLVAAKRSFGLVTTHDLSLVQVQEALPNHVICKHFSDTFDGKALHFSYELKDGVATSTNALHVLELAGVHIPTEID